MLHLAWSVCVSVWRDWLRCLLGGPKEPHIWWGSKSPYGKGQFWGVVQPIENHRESLLFIISQLQCSPIGWCHMTLPPAKNPPSEPAFCQNSLTSCFTFHKLWVPYNCRQCCCGVLGICLMWLKNSCFLLSVATWCLKCAVWAQGNPSSTFTSPLPHLLLCLLVPVSFFLFSFSLSYSLRLFSCFSIPSYSTGIVPLLFRLDVVGDD